MNANTERFVIDIDALADDCDAVTQLARCADIARVTFTNIALYTRDDANADRARFSAADTLVAFDATPADALAYADAFDCDPDYLVPIDLAHTFF
jgi:hypothetical protein